MSAGGMRRGDAFGLLLAACAMAYLLIHLAAAGMRGPVSSEMLHRWEACMIGWQADPQGVTPTEAAAECDEQAAQAP